MIETEVKIKITDDELEQVISILGNAEFVFQKNIVYKIPKGYLRVRFEDKIAILTYKGERKNDLFGSREELEI